MAKTKTINSKSRKEDIFEAYQQLKRQQRATPSLAEEAQERADVAALQAADAVDENTFRAQLEAMRVNASELAHNLAEEMTAKFAELRAVGAVVHKAHQRVEEVTGIDAEVIKLDDIIAARKLQAEEMRAEREAHDAALESEREEAEASIEGRSAAALEEQRRARAKFDYDFTREKIRRHDELEDEVTAMRRALKVEADEWGDTKARVEQAEAAVEAIKAEMRTAVEDALASSEKKHKAQLHAALHAQKVDADALLSITQGKLDNAVAEAARLADDLDTARAEVKDAYERMQQISLGALEAQGSRAMLAEVQSAVGKVASPANGKR